MKIATKYINSIPLNEIFFFDEISTYKNVIVIWDKDHDIRILSFIDSLIPEMRDHIIACGETEGELYIYWNPDVVEIPEDYREDLYVAVEDDTWNVSVSKIIT